MLQCKGPAGVLMTVYMPCVYFLFQLSMSCRRDQGGEQDSQEVKLRDEPGI